MVSAQYAYAPINFSERARSMAPLYALTDSIHTSYAPMPQWDLQGRYNHDEWAQGLAFHGGFFDRWLGRVLFSEHLLDLRRKDFDLVADVVVDFSGGFEAGPGRTTWRNTRGLRLEGRIGSQLTFFSQFLENQAQLPSWVESFANAQNAVPQEGLARRFKTEARDFSWATAVVNYRPSRFFSFSLGQDKHFIGEGYRSMYLSDNAFNYPFFRIETTFWRIKYTNLWARTNDIRNEAQINGLYGRKYISSHHLSIRINNRLNLGFFEMITYGDSTGTRGLDWAYLNPIIFYRPVEIAQGSKAGNAVLGTDLSYKIANGLLAYGQFVLDEFSIAAIRERNGSWVNKYAWQLGIKYHNAFKVQGLFLLAEYNQARPYTYSHGDILNNYGHFGQSMAHPWGANFREGVFRAQYNYKRWECALGLNAGIVGLDTNGSNWGQDIYQSYNTREQDLNNRIGQGVTTQILIADARVAWFVNPASRMKVELGLTHRRFEPNHPSLASATSNWVYFGLRTELFNRYYDF
jgi:hypothetical protein